MMGGRAAPVEQPGMGCQHGARTNGDQFSEPAPRSPHGLAIGLRN